MASSVLLVLLVLGIEAEMDLNPLHQLCQPCILAANAVKSTNKAPSVKEAEKRTCNGILKNELVCNGAVEVAGIYLNWTPAETICANFQMCGAADERKKMRAPTRAAKRPDELAVRVLQVFGSDEFPIFPSNPRFSRQSGSNVNFKEVEHFEKLLREHSDEINSVLEQFLGRFKNALQVYLDASSQL